jgi:soluble lytic murein transglycosylase-like protein
VGALSRVLAMLLLWLGAPAAARDDPRWAPFIAEASARFDIPESWIRRVISAESGGRTHRDGRPIESRAGAMGLMQLMPGTWTEIRARLGLGSDPHAPRDNILAGTFYLRLMYDRFGFPGLFAAYNAGPARYARHLATGSPLPAETTTYLAAVTGDRHDAPPGRGAAASIFAKSPDEAMPDMPATRARIFFPLGTQSAPAGTVAEHEP